MAEVEGSMRKGDKDKDFRKKLQNPPNPVNPTAPSPEMEEHLKKINSGVYWIRWILEFFPKIFILISFPH